MKTKFLFLLSFLLLATNVFSQEKQDTIMLRDGNLTFIQVDGCIESLENSKINRKIPTHYKVALQSPTDEMLRDMFRTIFTKERAAELGNYSIGCFFYFSSIDKKVISVRFRFRRDNEQLLLTLQELDKLEKAFKSLKLEVLVLDDMMFYTATCYRVPITFNRLYKDDNN